MILRHLKLFEGYVVYLGEDPIWDLNGRPPSRRGGAYGGEPTVNLLRSFLNLGRASDWLTLSNRGGADVLIALVKPITHLANWKGNFFYVENSIIPLDYPELLLESNKFDKKSFRDKNTRSTTRECSALLSCIEMHALKQDKASVVDLKRNAVEYPFLDELSMSVTYYASPGEQLELTKE
ncbi:hypothetical protein Tco_0796733 [Tanacetum coccineum]